MKKENGFGENLIELRKMNGVTRRELANKLDINENTLTGYEKGGREPRYELLIKIADFFGVSVDTLVRPTKSYLSIPYSVKSDNQTITVGSTFTFVDIPNKFSTISLTNCLADNLKTSLFNFRLCTEDDIFAPKDSTEINLSCVTDDLRFQLNLNLKIERTEDNGKNVDN